VIVHLAQQVVAHNRPTLGVEEQTAARRVLESGWVTQGPEVESFENEMCEFLGLPAEHAVAVSSGSAALFLALKILGGGGALVACPVYACSALTNAIALAGARCVLVDTSPDSPNIDVASLSSTGADIAIVPHMLGLPANLGGISGPRIVEDAAQALGARVGDKQVGVSGDVGVLSFYASKIMTTGGHGGMLVSRNRDFMDEARDFRAFDGRRDRVPRFNFQMTDLQAAVGRAQLEKLPSFIARRSEIYERYKRAGFPILEDRSFGQPVRYRCVIRSNAAKRIIENLECEGIKAIVPIEDWELLGSADAFPQAAALARSTVSLPIYPSLSDQEQDRVIDVLRQSASALQ
jgi:perosamine synthetase